MSLKVFQSLDLESQYFLIYLGLKPGSVDHATNLSLHIDTGIYFQSEKSKLSET